MSVNKYVFGALMFLLLAGSLYAAGEDQLKQSTVDITPNEDGTLLTIRVFVYEAAKDEDPIKKKEAIQEILEECKSEGAENLYSCMEEKSIARDIISTSHQIATTPLANAHVNVQYWNIEIQEWRSIQGCGDLITKMQGTGYVPSETGAQVPLVDWYTQCDISSLVTGQPKTVVRAVYTPGEADNIKASTSPSQTFINPEVSAVDAFTAELNNIMTAISEGGGGIAPLPTSQCVGVFLILGLLLSSLYFAGKSPISLLDITTPRLPAPKGVTAGGQMLMPFGWTELKKTTKAKMKAAAGALAASGSILASRKRGDAGLSRLQDKVNGLKGTAADRAAGDVGEQKEIMRSALNMGRMAGLKDSELDLLTKKLMYHYGDAEHRVIAKIIEKLQAMGDRERLMAMTLQDYVLGQRTFKSLEVITAHPDIGKRSLVHQKMSNLLTKTVGVNRYAIVGGFVPGMLDSAVRTGRVVSRGTKATVTLFPELVRATSRTTMEMLGGKHAVEDLAAKARTSPTAAWLHGQLTKHPSQVVVGQPFAINDKMAFLYKTLHDEVNKDSMRYVLRQLYKGLGLRFEMSEEELVRMGYTDKSILGESGYLGLSAAKLARLREAEVEMRTILSDTALTSQEKLAKLTALAKSYGAEIDHNFLAFSTKIDNINQLAEADHIKLILLQKELEEANKIRMSTMTGGHMAENDFVCHVGGDSLRGNQVWETMVLRTMIWDAENGHLKGGIKEELLSARLNVVNRMTGLDASDPASMAQLPEHMRNATQLKALAERNRHDMIELFTDQGKRDFQKLKGKAIGAASISEIVDYMYGGGIPKTGHIDPKTGRMIWWEADMELPTPAGAAKVDLSRHWITSLDPRQNIAIGQWTESRFTRSYVPPYKASIEAELDRMTGSAAWSVQKRTQEAKKLWVLDQLKQDMEQRFNSQFGHNTYGTTKETTRFYTGVLSGFMTKALEEKGLSANHPDRLFIENMDHTSPKDLSRLKELMHTYKKEYETVTSRPVTYDDITRSNNAMVMLHEGGLVPFNKGMMLSDADRVMAGEVALRDKNGQFRKFVPDDVPVNFEGNTGLMHHYADVRYSKDPNKWHSFIDEATKWAKTGGGYNAEREKQLAAVLWQYGNTTHDYSRFWEGSAVSVQAKRQVTPLAPSPLRFFGVEGHKVMPMIKPFRDIALHGGDYISKIALAAGGPLHKAAYDITPTSEYYKQHSFKLASTIMSGRGMEGLSGAERTAYRAVAMQHHGYHQVWDFAIDRNPWRTSTSFGTQQSWGAYFHFGPGQNFNVRDNLRSYMSKGEYMNFMSLYGFPLDLAGKMLRPYTSMIKGMQMSMQGYASKWDSTPDALRQWNYTEPRLREAMQSLNPFSYQWFPGKTSERISKLNVFGGSLEHHQLAGPDFMAGLGQAPQDIFLQRKGVYASARTGAANPGASHYNYRKELQFDQPMADYVFRMKEAAYLYDKRVEQAAMSNTQRRTVSAEALAIRRDQELRGFGVMQNPLYGWANPIAFLWHVPVPGAPQTLTPKDIVGNMVRKHKYGYGESWGDTVRGVANSVTGGAKKVITQPHLVHRAVYCPKCGRGGLRGAVCMCGQALY